MKPRLEQFIEIWAVDFEFCIDPGDRPTPVCLVAWELFTGQKIKVWQDELYQLRQAPYDTSSNALFVAYYASAEISCHLALGWPVPVNILDLFPEFRNLTNGKRLPCGNGLIGALTWFGFGGLSVVQKETMRDLILTGGPWDQEEKTAILDYCESDVRALTFLLQKMAPDLDMPRALIRGRYMAAAAKIEHQGIPVDLAYLNLLRENWQLIKEELIAKVDADYKIFDGQSFRSERFANWLIKKAIPWPHLESGALDLKDDTFREMAKAHPEVSPLRELRVTLSSMRLADLAVGKDGRNRCLLSAFQARTGRNAPSNSKFIFGPSVWLRGLIKPEQGTGLAYVDWSQQEFGIAAALSKDPLMMNAYLSGDPYLEFAKQAGAVPLNATKDSHSSEREQFKSLLLAVNYGMGERALASRIGQPPIVARELLRLHRETYQDFWRWSDGALDYAMFYGSLQTTFGWNIHINENPNPRMLRNFLIQANGAEMLRIAVCLIQKQGIDICAPIHDAVLIQAPLEEIEEKILITQEAMAKASRIVLNGFHLSSDVKVVRFPKRYMDKRGLKMWRMVAEILQELGLITCKEATYKYVR